MSLPASARLNPSALTVTTAAADELLSGMQDEDDLRDVDAVFESLLNNTFDEEKEDNASKRAPNSKQLQVQRQEQSGTPSPSPSEYDTACDPWDDY